MSQFAQILVASMVGMVQVLSIAGVIWVMRSISDIGKQMAVLIQKISTIKEDLDAIKGSYVGRSEFSEATSRLDRNHMELKEAFWKLHDEHIACHVCRDKPATSV